MKEFKCNTGSHGNFLYGKKQSVFIAKKGAGILVTAIACAACFLLLGNFAWAHCDTVSGPVIREAKAALEKGDVTPILKWVKKEHEAEIIAAFSKTIAVRTKGAEAKELADQYFIETLVRLHRVGEGEPYTGIKDEPPDAIVVMADKSLVDGSADQIIKQINAHTAAAIDERFRLVLEARKNKDTSVAAGREFVEAYVAYMHFVEGIHSAIISAGGHKHVDGADGKVSRNAEHDTHRE